MEPTPPGLNVEIFALALPLTMGIVQLLKEAGLPARWSGIAAVVVGTLAGLLVQLAGLGDGTSNPHLAALTGTVAGLAAAGVWSGTKAVMARDG
jgi:hypothetical protein